MRLLLLLAMLAPLSAGAGDVCRATSGARLRPLVELYTSEGCNSCPPADRWLTRHFAPGAEATALAFHVDYWDGLGWKDRFATPEHTARQYRAMRANGATFVYTPQVLVQGRDYAAWRRGAPDAALASAATRAPGAAIGLAARVSSDVVDADVDVTLEASPSTSTTLAVAYADSGLSSEVKAGENRGERLRHDHVVRRLVTRDVDRRSARFSFRLPRPAEAGERASLVAFVQEASSGAVLQTLELSLEGCR
jgi:hypothetical protein